MADKILISTDIASDTDDALSVLASVNSGIDVKGVYTVNGDVGTRAYVARHLLDLAGRGNIEVGVGSSESYGDTVPYSNGSEDALIADKYFYEEEGEFEVQRMPFEKVGITADGVSGLVKKLGEKHSIFTLGPLTDIARVLHEHPEVVKNIERLYVMGCRFTPDNDAHEHNVRYDVPAARLVFESDLPITVIPGDVCSEHRMPVEILNQLTSPAGKYAKKMAEGFIANKVSREMTSGGRKYLLEDFFKNSRPEQRERQKMVENLFKRGDVLANLEDMWGASAEPGKYMEEVRWLINYLKNDFHNAGRVIGEGLEKAIPLDLSVSDVYVPYCFLNQDKLEIEKANVTIDERGISRMAEGDKHAIVTGIDFNDFDRFVGKFLI